MEIRIPKWAPAMLVLLLLAGGAMLAFPRVVESQRSDVEVAKRAAVQIQAMREDETYDALSPELAERFRRDAARLPASERNRSVEVLGAALVRQGDGFSEVAVIVRVARPGAVPLESRAFYRVQNGKVVRVFPAMP